MQPKALDLCCGAGGASMGLHQAGFDVTGVDNRPQRHYPFRFLLADALEVLRDLAFVRQFALIWASFPCQAYTVLRSLHPTRQYPNLIPVGRQLLQIAGIPYIIENVIGAPLHNAVMLCGAMFGLKVYRHRLFESSHLLLVPPHVPHRDKTPGTGRGISPKGFISLTGNGGNSGGVAYARVAMSIDWMTRSELSQAIPPAYSAYLGRQLLPALARQNL